MTTVNTNSTLLGYARVSSKSQNLDSQTDQLLREGCIKIFHDKQTGKTLDREGWAQLLEYARPGDTIVVSELSRMSRSLKDLLSISVELDKKNIHLLSIKEKIDTKTAIGRFFFSIIGAMSQMEIELKKERAEAGRLAAKARGRSGGRPRLDPDKLEQARIIYQNSEKTAQEVCTMVGISRKSFYSYIKKCKEN